VGDKGPAVGEDVVSPRVLVLISGSSGFSISTVDNQLLQLAFLVEDHAGQISDSWDGSCGGSVGDEKGPGVSAKVVGPHVVSVGEGSINASKGVQSVSINYKRDTSSWSRSNVSRRACGTMLFSSDEGICGREVLPDVSIEVDDIELDVILNTSEVDEAVSQAVLG